MSKVDVLNCANRLSKPTGGALKDSLLITMTELLCCWEERWVTVEDCCEIEAAFQVQSAYESIVGGDAILLSIYSNALQPYVS